MRERFSKNNLFFFFCALIITSIVFSPFLLSVGMIGLFLSSFLEIKWGNKLNVRINKDALAVLKQFKLQPYFWIIMLPFFLVLFDFWRVEDYDFWLTRLRIKAPFLLLPMAFLVFPRLSIRQLNGILYFLIVLLFIACLGIGVNFYLHQEEIINLINQGQPMPTPRNHIRFSLLLAMGVISGGYLYFKGHVWKYEIERKIILFITIFLYLFIHFLSVRTGILVLYSTFLALSIGYMFSSKRYILVSLLLLSILFLPLIAYHTFPSLKAKIEYMKWDWKMYKKGKGEIYSDSGRIISLKVGGEIIKKHPLFGVGTGNLRLEVHTIFDKKYPHFKTILMPHNQFIYILASLGLIGGGIFTFAIFFPLFYKKNYQHPLMLSFYVTVFVAFMLEHTIENSIGVAYFLFFQLLFLNHLNGLNNKRLPIEEPQFESFSMPK